MKNEIQPNRRNIRNLLIFAIASLASGWLGLWVDRTLNTPNPQQGPGLLLWLIIPAGMGLLLRAFGGDGWRDAGLRFHIRAGWRWYLLALLIFPAVSTVVYILGSLAGAISQGSASGLGAFASLAAIAFISSFVKNIFEELAWRGYLTARLDAIKLSSLVNHLITGVIWSGWHLAYWLYILDIAEFTTLSRPAFVLVGIFTLVVTAITYGELRLLSNSIWPAVILHSMANAITATLLLNGFIQLNGATGVVLSPGNEGIVHAILFAAIGFGLYRYRKSRLQATA